MRWIFKWMIGWRYDNLIYFNFLDPNFNSAPFLEMVNCLAFPSCVTVSTFYIDSVRWLLSDKTQWGLSKASFMKSMKNYNNIAWCIRTSSFEPLPGVGVYMFS